MHVVVDRLEQPRQRVNGTDDKLRELFHARLARTTILCHRPVLLAPRESRDAQSPRRQAPRRILQPVLAGPASC